MVSPVDPLELGRALIRCPSVTPEDAGALDVLSAALEPLGFSCHRLRFEEQGTAPVENLYARRGAQGANFCFAGHTDVVPPGPGWSVDPFAAEVRAGRLYGRGAADMKTAIACFVAAVSRHLQRGGADGRISLLITGDEEGPAVNGTRKVLDWLAGRGERLDACLVGEPTNPNALGEMIKIGRRGSLNVRLRVQGVQGHAAYPHLADNPIPRLIRMLTALGNEPLDAGTDYFPPSTLTLTSIDVGNVASNVIPGEARAAFNIRFNDRHTAGSLRDWIETRCQDAGSGYALEMECSGEVFVCAPGPLAEMVAGAVTDRTGRVPELSTSGGTSDARFLKDACPVCEFGMVGESAHKVDENVSVADLEALTDIYAGVLARFFGMPA
ncbi:MAG TPA: succinyl-diaminopimelate desuccinylase [Rhodospirillales bacterium]|nr:succinyl-diaminopimelate desuccinylase [Rhodospirillales bacterium]